MGENSKLASQLAFCQAGGPIANVNVGQSASPPAIQSWGASGMLGSFQDGQKEEDQDVDSHDAVLPKPLPDPGAPSRQEVLEHEMTHIPFRVWCPHCVAARAKSMKHLIDKYKDEHG